MGIYCTFRVLFFPSPRERQSINPQIYPGFLQRVIVIGGQAFDRGDILARHHRNRRLAGTHRPTVQVHRASAAHPDAAAIFRPGEFQACC
jgi:hypothetical protein